jgi:hypothetical protein
MRKTILVTSTLLLVWIGYLAWPLYDLFKLAQAVENGDVLAVTKRVDFARVRQSLSRQLIDTYTQRPDARRGALVESVVGAVADPVIAKIISPEAFADMLSAGWPRNILPQRPRDAVGISIAGLGTAWAQFAAASYGFGRFEIMVPVSLPPEHALGLEMRLSGWRWRLAGIRLPDHIRKLIVDEIAKSVRPPAAAAP